MARIFSNINISSALASFCTLLYVVHELFAHKGNEHREPGAGFHESFLAVGLICLGDCFMTLILGYHTRAAYQDM